MSVKHVAAFNGERFTPRVHCHVYAGAPKTTFGRQDAMFENALATSAVGQMIATETIVVRFRAFNVSV